MKENHEGRGTALALPRRSALSADMTAALSSPDQLDQTLHLRDLLQVFLKRKWTILAIFAISALFSVVLSYLAAPVFRASTTIQIERFTPQVMNYKDVTPVETYDYDGGDFYYTNYELLKSRALAERAADDIGLRRSAPSQAVDDPGKEDQSVGQVVRDFFDQFRASPVPIQVDQATALSWAPSRARSRSSPCAARAWCACTSTARILSSPPRR